MVTEEAERPERPPGRPWRVLYWVTFGMLCAVVAGLIAGFFLLSKSVVVLSAGMSPTIPAGSTVQYQRGAGGIVRGDVVVIQSPRGQQISRVIGLPGDRVMCCNSDGWMEVDGQTLYEYYIPFNASPSQAPFPPPDCAGSRGRRRPGGGDRAGNGRHHQVGDAPPPAQTSPAAAVTIGQPPGVMRPDS